MQACRRLFLAALSSSLLLGPLPGSSQNAPAPEPRWFKGNTHTHSLWSDGNDFPEMITDWYRQRGYHFLAISDHNILHAKEVWMSESAIRNRQKAPGRTALEKYQERFKAPWVETRVVDGATEVRLKKLEEYRPLFEKPGEFLLIQAEELSANFPLELKKRVPIHINALNLSEVILPPEKGESIQDVMRKSLQAIQEQGRATGKPVLAHVNHPNFRWALTAEDLAAVLEENFFEIFNGHPIINYLGDGTRPGHETIWDVANTLRLTRHQSPPLYGVATDDAHHYHGEDSAPGRGWIMVRSQELSPDALIASLRTGDFYASSGVSLRDAKVEGGILRIVINAQPGVAYTTRFVGTPENFDATTTAVPSPNDEFRKERLVYSADVGKTFAAITGPVAEYRFTGKELYVRAVITSDRAHPNPAYEGQVEMAWTQPVGWESRVPVRK